MEEKSDPKIVERLKKMPPFDDVVEEQPQEEIKEEEQTEEQPQEQEIEVKTDNERTKEQFNKVLESNKSLKQENEQLKKNVLESLRPEAPISPVVPTVPSFIPQFQPQQPIPQAPQSPFDGLVDEDNYVDAEKLKALAKATQEANERAIRAEQMAREAELRRAQDKRDFEESQLMRQIHTDYPEIDPKSEVFDQTLYDAVRNELVSQFRSGTEDIRGAVEKWHKVLIKPDMTKEEAEKKAEQKSQIIATNPSTNRQPATTTQDFESLRKGTMYNTKGALAERLKRSGY